MPEHTGIHTWSTDCPACPPLPEPIDTSTWECKYVMVPVSALRVTKVDHEVVQWEATFSSEDAIPMTDAPSQDGWWDVMESA